MDSSKLPPAPPAAPPRRKRRVLRWLAIALSFVAVAIAAGYAFIASEAGLRFAAQMIIDRSDGRLEVDSPAGSLLSSVRVKRLVWRGPGATLTADEIALNWNPFALLSRGIVVKGLGAQRITLAIEASDSAAPLPVTLTLPTNIEIQEVAVANFDWAVGKNSGTLRGVTFGFSGGATTHRIERLSLVMERGTLTGNLAVDARPPFAIKGALAFDGDPKQKAAHADMTVSGTIDAIALNADGRAGTAQFTASARLTPFAAVALDTLSLDARELDLAEWDPALPVTRLSLKAEARPDAGGLAGRFDAANAIAGPIDKERLPVRSLAARFAWHADALTLDDVVAELAGGGRAAGRANVPLNGDAGKWTLDVRDVDLRQLYTPLAPTRLTGTLGADLAAANQRIDGNIADRTIVGGIGVSFAATVADRKLVVERFQIRAGTGELAGSGRAEFTGRRAFEVTAKAKHVDPSRFGKFPAGALDGDVAASGELEPAWRVAAKVTIATGSRLAGEPVAGTARAVVSAHAVRDATIDVKFASAKMTASGSAGEGADGLTIALDAPQLGEFAALLPPAIPRPLTGKLTANAVMRGDIARGGLELQAHGEALKAGTALSIGTFDTRVSVAPASAAGASADPNNRPLKIDLAATAIAARAGTLSRAHVVVDGTLAQHTTSLSFAGGDLDVEMSAHGSLRESRNTAGADAWTWTGAVDSLENRGAWTLRLAAPATFDIARGHVHIGATRIAVADGNVDLATLAWDDGRITTRGAFTGVPVASLALIAGVKFPFTSTLTLAGDWSLVAAPQLNGAINVHREGGDILLNPETIVDPGDRAMRITAVDLAARFHDDAVDATASFRSGHGLNADAQLAIGVAPNTPPGRLAADAPLRLTLTADLATLKVLQPWVGTTAVVDGNAHADLTASGTLARAPFSGTIRAAGLRVAAPQYGLFFTDGRLNAHLTEGALTLDEFSLTGGAGRFTASGTLRAEGDLRADGQGAAASMTWKAEKFRLFNRPDLRLVVDGSGTLALKDRRISLEGNLTADEGHFEYAAEGGVTLGDDVVVKGWPAKESGTDRDKLPLSVDLELDFGRNLTFTGEGLETGLRGKVRVTTAADGTLRGRGSIQAVNGTYTAFGQRLVIDRGRLIFDGPLENPGLDIVALRKNQAVEAGVALSGTVKVPIIQLTSNPPVPDNEKLSWLVLGQGLDRTSGSDMAALQAASAALLGRGGKPITTTIAQSIGLDDISVGSTSPSSTRTTAGGSPATGQVVAFGKKLTDKLTLVYQQGLTVATNALRLEYSLTRTLTLRAEAGAISGFGIYYRRVFD